VRKVKIPLQYSGRHLAEEEDGSGICRAVIDRKYNRILGVHMFGNYVSKIITLASFMIESEYRIEDLRELVFPHPTVSEVVREALFSV